MKVFLDTASEDFILFLINNNNEIVDKICYFGYKKKVNLIVDSYKELLEKNNLIPALIEEYYTNIGPGFFTGIRSSLVFLRTFAMVFNKPIYVCNSFDILELQKEENYLTLDAQGNAIYYYDKTKKTINVLSDSNLEVMKVDYIKVENDWAKYLKVFKKIEANDLLKIQPLYIKKPQLGGIK
ncbi:tRNA (adenosine(37)-N6)-threonylcarbamoyltransferase complex dimerization subunit type 1 TsaB [Mycoplasmopsis alligatoris]|uniref:Universal bacterial protein YeaZ n=1 Tax=Mycoplasmopsis alligatoris A21JP2 TaxID=747682 RepID=D4XWE1_9BACT|nr:tRNA (adenosine(37)-N6)-threonylcarbamoyltransferase complex dimerization subunit type 1 TsaB [Mycoplasmopsis alligatoris]EFF41357.1 universal bacterial protein YeaZ [Mycoplasmopsis alligatoris A21JP2]